MQELDSIFQDDDYLKRKELNRISIAFILFCICDSYFSSVIHVKFINFVPRSPASIYIGASVISFLVCGFIFDFFNRNKKLLISAILFYFICCTITLITLLTKGFVKENWLFDYVLLFSRSGIYIGFIGVLLSLKTKNEFYLKLVIFLNALQLFIAQFGYFVFYFLNPEDTGLVLAIAMLLLLVVALFLIGIKNNFSAFIIQPISIKIKKKETIYIILNLLLISLFLLFYQSIDSNKFIILASGTSTHFELYINWLIFFSPLLFSIVLLVIPINLSAKKLLFVSSSILLFAVSMIYWNSNSTANKDGTGVNIYYYFSMLVVSGELLIFAFLTQLYRIAPRKYISFYCALINSPYLVYKVGILVFPNLTNFVLSKFWFGVVIGIFIVVSAVLFILHTKLNKVEKALD